jgi:3-oxoacyl-[acyl-carrier protein] reductase
MITPSSRFPIASDCIADCRVDSTKMAEKMLSLAGKTAIVTGGSQGIGRDISLLFAKQGAHVVVNYASNEAKAKEVIATIEGSKGKAIAVQGDVSKESDVKRLFDQAEAAFGPPHIVVNSAGIALSTLPTLVNTTGEDWDKIYAVNTKGAFLVSKEAALRIPPASGGRIVNITTTVVSTLLPNYAVYASSKAAVETFTLILAKELRGKQITANCVSPGPVATEFFFRGKTEAAIEAMKKAAPLERLGEPDDIANVVLFIVSNEGQWINAQVVRVNGGTGSAR